MRLTTKQIETIREIVHTVAGSEARTVLYGSRLDDNAPGGDIDLLIETDEGLMPLQRARLKLTIEARLGLPADILSKKRKAQPTAFQAIALAQGVEL
jgi:predicted nucleotidyltransferase